MALSFAGGGCSLPQGHALPSGLHLLEKYTQTVMQFQLKSRESLLITVQTG